MGFLPEQSEADSPCPAWLMLVQPSFAFSPFLPANASILRKATTAATTPTIRSTVSPTPPEALAIESRKAHTLLRMRIEAPMSRISIQMIFSFA